MRQTPTIEEVKSLTILQLNDLVKRLGMSKYWYSASMRTLQYSDEVLEEIREYCTIGRMLEILEYDYKNETGITRDFLCTKGILNEVANVISKDMDLCKVLFSNVTIKL